MNWRTILESRKTTVVLIALVTVFLVHVIARNSDNLRADLTANDLYSLSDGTLAILDKMNQEGVKPIELKLYFSETAGKTLPKFIKDFITYERYLRALLREYALNSEGKIVVEYIDPVPDTDEAQDALDFGLDGKPINQHGDLFFFGLVLLTQTGSKDVIDFLWPSEQETVEYEISKRIHSLIWPNRKRLGVLSSLDVLSEASNPYMAQLLAAQGKDPGRTWLSMKLLEESYQVSRIDTDADEIPADEFDLLVVVHPKNLSEKTLWAIDEWIVRGGNALIFLDPFALDDQPPANPQNPWQAQQYKPSSNLDRLLERWGIRRAEDRFAADFDLAVKRQVSRRGPAERLLVDLQIDSRSAGETLDTEHPILQGLNELRFFLAGTLETTETPATALALTPLITTTSKGDALEIQPGFPGSGKLVYSDVNDPARLADVYTPGGTPLVLAYLVQGRFDPLFPEGGDFPDWAPPEPPPGLPPGVQLPPPEDTETIHKDAVPEEERNESTVLVFADVDFISDEIGFQRSFFGTVASNDNHRVLLNAVDYLMGSQELMKVRAKKSIRRPFTLFDRIEDRAALETRERERQLRADIERFQTELQEKQSGMSSRNAALFQKQLRDDVDQINDRIQEANKELRLIRKQKRAALEGEEARVRFATLWTTPMLVLGLGLVLFYRRKRRDQSARRSAS